MNTIINSAAYEDIADFKILFIQDLQQLIQSFQLLRNNAIIYCKTDFTPMLFEHLKFSGRKYVLISHHSDYSIDKIRFNQKPPCIIKWYAINTTYKHPDLITIPAGIWTSEGRAYHQPHHKIQWFKDNIKNLRLNEKNTDTVYCNWGDTNLERKKIIENLNVKYKWVHGISFKEYCEDMSKYKFVISPPGNGIDCHRTWEALYLGCYPIVIKNMIYDDWKELPIIQVSDYSEVSEDFLSYYLNKSCNFEKLYVDYWIKRIKI